jgi:transposase
MDATTYALDTAKHVMQLHWVQPDSGEICRRKLSRAKLMEFVASRRPACIAMEACAGSHHLARCFMALGHQVQLLPAREVRKCLRGSKDDAADARAIWLAAQQTDIRRVPVKSCQQQAVLALHRMRSHWVSVRTATINALRGLLYEFGVILPQGKRLGLQALKDRRPTLEGSVPEPLLRMLDAQLALLERLEEPIKHIEAELGALQQALPDAKRLREVPGIGLLGATAATAMLGDASGWKNARVFACSLGLAPRHWGSGGKVTMGSMSKRGDPYLRTLLISGARAVLRSSKAPEWAKAMLLRRPANVVAVALAAKMARTAWALVRHQHRYDGRLGTASAAA